MIDSEDSIPSKSHTYRSAEDLFYIQFNEISFFIEDDNQENFYYCILRNLFPDIEIAKIFPLGGKKAVIDHASENNGELDKVYIVDKDFDDLLDSMVTITNLFYLQRYEIENYLLERNSIIEYVIGENPSISRDQLDNEIKLKEWLEMIGPILHELIYLFVLIQINELEIKNAGQNHERFIQYNEGQFSVRTDQLQVYKNEIEIELRRKDGRFTLNSRLNKVKKMFSLSKYSEYITHVPGKYITKMYKRSIENRFDLKQRDVASFHYRLADKCSFEALDFLKQDVQDYLNQN